ncbi:hypothetical protein GCM10008959_27030 [Deinococcus seoulensis]|uniref:Uncharacterized protein n=1 Tax=Deinococcus seoulensis TaxID=1837379 RepID=A0ABQ2RTE1_9DEIO|nr:hypothetical protein [Deinococcus seoulensis]GGR63490.1 hypothetical protein GCM10008959_27030 [Deinococcus seoulensis]
MSSERMTITKALSELKLLEKRANKLIDETPFVTFTVGAEPPREARSAAEFTDRARARRQSVTDLLRRRSAIKAAVVASNARTTVDIAGQTYTVAAAIERKASVAFEQRLIARLRSDLARAQREVELHNERAGERLDQQAQALLGKEGSRGAEYEALHRSFMDRNAARLLDPLDAQADIDRLSDQVDAFLAEVDQTLSVSNALTVIDVP